MSKVLVELDSLTLGTSLLLLCIFEGIHLDNFDEMRLDQSFLPYIHIYRKVTLFQGYGTLLLPGPLPHNCSAHLGEYDKQAICLASLMEASYLQKIYATIYL